jgi:DNA polymerase-3 subunit epsilon
MREIILDLETTGLNPNDGHKIVEIAMIELIDRRLTERIFHSYLNPKRNVPQNVVKIHGITNDFLSDKPCFEDIIDSLLEFIGDNSSDKIVIHNARFDINFLNYELELIKRPPIDKNRAIDTLILAKSILGHRQKVNLDALCKLFKINNSNRILHGAVIDCHLLYKVYCELLNFLNILMSDEK